MARPKNAENEIDNYIGAQIKIARVGKGWGRTEFGRMVGVSHQQITKYEDGCNRVSVSRLISIANTLNLPLEYFYKEEVKQAAPQELGGLRNAIEVSRHLLEMQDKDIKDGILHLIRVIAQKERKEA